MNAILRSTILVLGALAGASAAAAGPAQSAVVGEYTLTVAGQTGRLLGFDSMITVVDPKTGAMTGTSQGVLGDEELTFRFETGLPTGFTAWLGQGLATKATEVGVGAQKRVAGPSLSGTVMAFSQAGTNTQLVTFQQAMLAAVDFPAFDARSKSPAILVAKAKSPISLRRTMGDGKTPRPAVRPVRWLLSGYRLSLTGLDLARASRIAAFTWNAGTAPRLVVALPAADGAALGKAAQARAQHEGKLELVDIRGQPLYEIILHGVTVASIAKSTAPGDPPNSYEATLVPATAVFSASPGAAQ